MSLEIVILAAGKGTRMKSSLPKVLHTIAGIPMIEHALNAVLKLNPDKIHMVCGYGIEKIKNFLETFPVDVHVVEQKEQLGTAHAVLQCIPFIKDDSNVLVLFGDTPMVREATLHRVLSQLVNSDLAVLTASVSDPSKLGRIIRDQNGSFVKIVEEKDATPEQLEINEINTGICCGNAKLFKEYLPLIGNNNKQQEYYLTDLFSIALSKGKKVATAETGSEFESLGVNDRLQQAKLERLYQMHQAEELMQQGVFIVDPARFDLRGTVKCGQDVVIDTNVIIEGDVTIGNNVVIGTGCLLKNCSIGDGSVISPYSVIESSILHNETTIGPFARLRPGCELADKVHVGNFVEVKNSKINKGTKAGHLTYIGDSEVGSDVNFGAGTITCNYDGANKHKTVIGDDVFIGSDTQLIAPVTIGNGATLGAGSTISKNVKDGELVITRVPQRHIPGWARPVKNKK